MATWRVAFRSGRGSDWSLGVSISWAGLWCDLTTLLLTWMGSSDRADGNRQVVAMQAFNHW